MNSERILFFPLVVARRAPGLGVGVGMGLFAETDRTGGVESRSVLQAREGLTRVRESGNLHSHKHRATKGQFNRAKPRMVWCVCGVQQPKTRPKLCPCKDTGQGQPAPNRARLPVRRPL